MIAFAICLIAAGSALVLYEVTNWINRKYVIRTFPAKDRGKQKWAVGDVEIS
jgi:hypothetical protein